jgi:hypothetical protein
MLGNKPIIYRKLEVFSNENNDSVDIRGGVPVLEYRESVLSPYITIDLSIIDAGTAVKAKDGSRGTIGLLESIKLQADEKFKMILEDQYGNKIDLSKDTDLKVGKTAFATINNRQSTVVIRVVSKEAYDNTHLEKRMVNSYLGKGDEIIEEALKSLKTEKDLFADTTQNDIQFNGDKRYPFEMCLDVQKVSIPVGIKSAGFLFWETSKGYNFRSLDKMFDQTGKTIKKFVETGFASQKVLPGYNGKILKSSFLRINDTLKQFEDGAYNAELDLFNPLNKTLVFQNLNSFDYNKNSITAGNDTPVISKDNRDEEGKAKATIDLHATKDVGQKIKPGGGLADIDDTSFDIVKTSVQSHQNYRQKFSISLNIVIDADLSLSAGDLVYCKFPETSQKPSVTGITKDSGIYMIADLCHYSTPTQAFTGLNLVRDSYGVKS